MDIFVLKLLLKNLVLPPTGPLILIAAGLALAISPRLRRAGFVLAAAATVLLWALATPVVADALVRTAERYPPLDLDRPVQAEAIVILAGGVRLNAPEYHHAAPGPTTMERIVYGARVAHATHLPVLVSGSHAEAAAMADVLEHDLAVTPRWIENHSRDTHENAVMSGALLSRAGVRRIVLVTSAVHMERSVREFRAVGFTVTAAPAEGWTRREAGVLGLVPTPDALMRSQRALYEALGLLVQRLRPAFAARGYLLGERPTRTAKAG